MKIVVLGAGMMARAAVLGYLAEHDVERVTVADHDPAALQALKAALLADPRLGFERFDASASADVERLMSTADGAFCGVHYAYNADLGGNNDVVAMQRTLDGDARGAGVCVTPDCGLAPGLASMRSWTRITCFSPSRPCAVQERRSDRGSGAVVRSSANDDERDADRA